METIELLENTVRELLGKMRCSFNAVTVEEEDKDDYTINIATDDPSSLIGYHGANIQALQHLIKVIAWNRAKRNDFTILLDIDDYRKKREAKTMELFEKKLQAVRETGREQALPPMAPYLRRKIHLQCMGAGYNDIETYSEGEEDRRHIVIKLK